MSALARSEMTYGVYRSPEETAEALDAVTREDVLALARRCWTLTRHPLRQWATCPPRRDYLTPLSWRELIFPEKTQKDPKERRLCRLFFVFPALFLRQRGLLPSARTPAGVPVSWSRRYFPGGLAAAEMLLLLVFPPKRPGPGPRGPPMSRSRVVTSLWTLDLLSPKCCRRAPDGGPFPGDVASQLHGPVFHLICHDFAPLCRLSLHPMPGRAAV